MAKYTLGAIWFLSGLALLLPSSALAAWDSARFTADTNVHIPGLGITLVVRSGSAVTSLAVLNDRIRITGAFVDAANRSSITLVSNQRVLIRNSWALPIACNPTYSSLTVTWTPASAGSIDITPSDVCGPPGGGGFVGGRLPDPAPTPAPTPAPKPAEMTLEEIRSEIARITALVAQLQAKLAERIAAVPQAFAVDLHYGLRNNAEVRRLQEFLIERGHLAPGLNTGNYLSLTVAAVRAYQEARGITPSTGNFGPRTRAAVNTDLGLSP